MDQSSHAVLETQVYKENKLQVRSRQRSQKIAKSYLIQGNKKIKKII
jgi:hypothetical protein